MRLDHITSSNLGYVAQQPSQHKATRLDLKTQIALTPIEQRSLRPQLIRNTERESVRVWSSRRTPCCEPSNRLPGDHSVVEPPDPIPNSEVKRNRADGSVAQAMQE